jgi:hypothetical protein
MEFAAERIDWLGKAGQRLEELAARLPREPPLEITIFGSAPLQLFVERAFLSEDIDLFTVESRTDFLQKFVEDNHWGEDQTDFYIQVCDPLAFKSTIDWPNRAITVARHGHQFRFVHPWDILVSKLQRLEEKDLNAFRIVIQKTGHPTEEEFVRHLQLAVDLYRPKFDEEICSAHMNQQKEQEMDARYLRHFIEKSRARLKELEQLKLANPAVPDLAIQMEREHLRKYEAQLVALNN